MPDGLLELAASFERAGSAANRAAQATDAWTRDWARWQMQFCATATDEEIAEADRLFGTDALSQLKARIRV